MLDEVKRDPPTSHRPALPARSRSGFASLLNAWTWQFERRDKPTPQERARLLYEYCVTSEKKVTETAHNLFIIAEHYAAADPKELDNPEKINGIPSFFADLTREEKAQYCYNQVTEMLSMEAQPVTIESLIATRREDQNNPWSSYAGRFVLRVTGYVTVSLLFMLGVWLFWGDRFEGYEVQWVAFGCLGALVHLLNYALTTTRLQTFELSETRKIWPRLLLGGMFGFILPSLLRWADVSGFGDGDGSLGSIAAFFGGYSVRFATGLIERLLSALFPETDPKRGA